MESPSFPCLRSLTPPNEILTKTLFAIILIFQSRRGPKGPLRCVKNREGWTIAFKPLKTNDWRPYATSGNGGNQGLSGGLSALFTVFRRFWAAKDRRRGWFFPGAPFALPPFSILG